MNQGWECPKCGRVYAPFVGQCQFCPPTGPLGQLSNDPAVRAWTCDHDYANPTGEPAMARCRKCGLYKGGI